MSELYIGLMSGTSADGINAAVVDFSESQPKLLAKHYQPYSADLRQEILSLITPGDDEINRLGELDVKLGRVFATCAQELLETHAINPQKIKAIGSHGQTIRHHPHKNFTLQIGDPNIIAAKTGITTIADFRRKDMALGGQGAPLVPLFHQAIFGHEKLKIILNLGGIANITVLHPNGEVFGFDTGPGNALMDSWTEKHLNQSYDKNGAWAALGKIQQTVLEKFLQDPFFRTKPPKSTGREYFNLKWLEQYISTENPVDIQTTLLELTAQSVLHAIEKFVATSSALEILICGGGSHNHYLIQRMKELGNHYHIELTAKYGVDPDWVEAMAFAWLAKQTLQQKVGNIPAVTGATKPSVLGGIYCS